MDAGRIEQIKPLLPKDLELEGPGGTPGAGASGASFGDALENALRGVDDQIAGAEETARDYLSGEGGDLHTVLLEMEKADLSFRTMVEVRNKLLDAYREIMRLPV